jgi:DNA invertase Pin-like site-specific DNA recombinase
MWHSRNNANQGVSPGEPTGNMGEKILGNGAVNIGFLRSTASMDELREEMAALEKAGCERIVVDNNPIANPQQGMLGAVVSRLSPGDSLVVWSLDSVANSMPELVGLALRLEARNVRFRSLADGFDTYGRHRAVLKATLAKLQEFERQLEIRHELEAKAHHARRVGRPRSLSPEDVGRARVLINEGRTMDEVSREFQVSRATLYRYLEE